MAEALVPFEIVVVRRADTAAQTEFGVLLISDRNAPLEVLHSIVGDGEAQSGATRSLSRLASVPFESSASDLIAVMIDAGIAIEWSATPSPLLISLKRLLRSPGRVRLLTIQGSGPLRRG